MIEPVEIKSSAEVRLPQLHHGEIEHRLASVNASLLRSSLKHITSLVPGLNLSDYTQTTDGASFALFTPGGGALLDELQPWDFLTEFLEMFHLFAPEQLRVVRNRKMVDPKQYLSAFRPWPAGRVQPNMLRLARLLDEGYSLVMDSMDSSWPELAEITSSFERAFGWPVNVNGYLSSRADEAFGTHWDDHEVVILQLLNKKSWQVGRSPELSMSTGLHEDSVPFRSVWSGDLEQGMAMYIPRGWPHAASASDGISFHLTVSCLRPTVIDLMRFACGRVPTTTVGEQVGQTSDEMYGALTSALGSLGSSDHEEFDRYAASVRLMMPSRFVRGSSRRLGESLPAQDLLRDPHSGGWLVVDQPEADGAVIAAGRNAWTCGEEALDVLDTVSQAHWPTIEEAIDCGASPHLVERAVEVGLIERVTAGSF